MVHCLQPNPDVPDVLAVGGEKNGIRLWKHSKGRLRDEMLFGKKSFTFRNSM